MPSRDKTREELMRELERLRATLSPQQYAIAAARILDKLKQPSTRPRYAIT